MAKQMNMNNTKLTPEQINMMAQALKTAKDIVCKSCGGQIFAEGIRLKELSKIITGDTQNQLIPIPAFFCVKCHTELKQEDLEKPAEENVIYLDKDKKS